MKKMLSLFLALLVMAVPALSTAESCPFSLSWLPARQSFVSPDLSDGQQLTLDLSVQPGSALLDVLPEEVRVPVQDLLSALTVEMSGWYSETAAQGSLRLLLNGESALDITGEAGRSGIFLASSLLGNHVLRVTPDQARALLEKALQQMSSQGSLPRETADSMMAKALSFLENPKALLSSLSGSPNPAALVPALLSMAGEPVTEPVTDPEAQLPAGVNFSAKTVTLLVLKKEALASRLSRFTGIWTRPSVQQLASPDQLPGAGAVAEKLTSFLRSLPDLFSEDVVLRIYAGESRSPVQILSDTVVSYNGNQVPLHLDLLLEDRESGLHAVGSLRADPADGSVRILAGEATASGEESGGSMTLSLNLTQNAGGTVLSPVRENAAAVWTASDSGRTLKLDLTVLADPGPDSEVICLVYHAEGSETDAGDHAEIAATVNVELENVGEVLTLTLNGRTAQAGSSVASDDAVEPFSMDGDEKAGLLTNLQASLYAGLLQFISKLPSSFGSLIMGLPGGGNQ